MDGSLGAIERGQEPVTSGRHLTTAEAVELPSHALVVLRQQLAPCVIADPLRDGRRAHDVREDQRRHDPLAAPRHRPGEGAHAGPIDRDPGLVADNPGVVAGGDLVDVVGRISISVPSGIATRKRPEML